MKTTISIGKFGGFSKPGTSKNSRIASPFWTRNSRKFPASALKKIIFPKKKTRKTYSPGTQNPKIEDLMRNRKLHLKNGLFSCSSNLPAESQRSCNGPHEPTSSQVAELQNTTWTRVQVWYCAPPTQGFQKGLLGVFMSLMTSWSNHLAI